MEDLDRWQVYVEDPAVTSYKGIDVYKLNHWVQGPVMLQTLNLLENVDLQVDGLQQRALHSHAVSSDEPGVRRSRLLLRRSVRAAGRADQGPAVEGVRTRAFRGNQLGAERSVRAARRSVSVPRRDESLSRAARALAAAHRRSAARAAERGRAAADARRSVPRRHDVDPSRRCGRLGRLDHAERRLGAGVHRRQHRRRPVAAHAELRARSRRQPVQRARRPASGRVPR